MFEFDQKIWKLVLLSPRPSEAEEFENFLSTSVFAFHVCFYLFDARLFSTSLHPLSFLAIWFAEHVFILRATHACERGRSCSAWTHPYHNHSTLFDTETIVNYSAARCTTTPHRFRSPYTHSRNACCVNAALRYMRDAERVKIQFSVVNHIVDDQQAQLKDRSGVDEGEKNSSLRSALFLMWIKNGKTRDNFETLKTLCANK